MFNLISILKFNVKVPNSVRYGMIEGALRKNNLRKAYKKSLEGVIGRNENTTHLDEWFWWKYFGICLKVAQEINVEQDICYFKNLANTYKDDNYDQRLVSECFIELSRWAFKLKDKKIMLDFVDKAIAKDPSWAEPYFLKGWFGLFLTEIDSIAFFKEAVSLDENYIIRIKNDKECDKRSDVKLFAESFYLNKK